MNKILFLLTFLLCIHLNAQETHRCFTTQYQQFLEAQNPGYLDSVNETFENAKSDAQATSKTDTVYRIPLVFHVVWNTAAENISDELIVDQVAKLNEDFNRQNPDSVNTRAEFLPVAGNAGVEFYLADIDPEGNPTTGITRTQTSITNFPDAAELFAGDFTSLERIKSTADGGIDAWDQSRYCNIWVGDLTISFLGYELPGLLGYATPPEGAPNWPPGSVGDLGDGLVIFYQVVGRNNPTIDPTLVGIADEGRTTIHEMGHYLGLRHIWGDGDCTMDDGLADTPPAAQQSQSDCNLNINSCSNDNPDLPDMVENYMDYSMESCMNMFTQDQVDIIRAMLEGPRNDLTLPLVQPEPVTADFNADITEAEPWEIIQFTANTTNATDWLWDFGDGTTSDLENPTHSYLAEGLFTVSLTASNAAFDATETKTDYILVQEPVSIEEEILLDIHIQPNPSTGIFKVNYEGGMENQTFSIRDLKGRLLQSGSLINNGIIDLTEFDSGIYFFESNSTKIKLVVL